MRLATKSASVFILASLIMTEAAHASPLNKVLGTWRMLSAQLDPNGRNLPAYGPAPSSLLVFTSDMHVIEVMTDSTVPKFASNARGHGTAEENQAAMEGSIGWFGTYTVDESGELNGDRVEGSTFPNWVGNMRAPEDIQLVVDGDRILETFRSAAGDSDNHHLAACALMHRPTVVSAGFCPKATAQTQVVNLRPTKTSLQES